MAAGVVGVVSTSGGEIGPFMAVEQAVLTEAMRAVGQADDEGRVAVMLGWYAAVGYLAQAIGALLSGVVVTMLHARGMEKVSSYRVVFVAYSMIGAALAVMYACLSPAVEAKPKPPSSPTNHDLYDSSTGATVTMRTVTPTTKDGEDSAFMFDGTPGLGWLAATSEAASEAAIRVFHMLSPKVSLGLRRPESKYIVCRLSCMFALDAFGGAFVMQTWVAFWFAQRWGFSSELIGYLLMASNVVAGISGVAAAHFVKRFGAMNTMVASHLPSNILLVLVPCMPTAGTAAAMLVARYTISQMDVPARHAYVVSVVAPDEMSAAGGITGIARSLGMAVAPLFLGVLSAGSAGDLTDSPLFNAPWSIAGSLKIVYDVLLVSADSLYGIRVPAGEGSRL
jgi:MFS family permease